MILKKKKFNWKIVLILILTFAIIGEALIYFRVEPIFSWTKSAVSLFTPVMAYAQTAYETMVKYPIIGPIIGTAVGGLVLGAVKKVWNDKMTAKNDEILQQEVDFNTQYATLNTKYQTIAGENADLKVELEKAQAQTAPDQSAYIGTLEGQLQTAITQRNMLDSQLSRILNDPLYLAYKQSQIQQVIP